MLQIKFILSEVSNWIKNDLKQADFENSMIETVESCFEIPVSHDVAVTIICTEHTRNERPIQIELAYICGTDEYNTGEIFDPDDSKKRLLAKSLKSIVEEHLKKMSRNGERYEPPKTSVWIRPQRGSFFLG